MKMKSRKMIHGEMINDSQENENMPCWNIDLRENETTQQGKG